MGGGATALWGGLANSLPGLTDWAGEGFRGVGMGLLTGNWGGTSKERKNVIHDIRTLRRREYQDLVHSLTKAGLNPMLAIGASPGHATAQQVYNNQLYRSGATPSAGVGGAIAANRQSGVAEGKAPSEKAKNEAGAALANQQATATQLGIPNILQQWDLNQATIDKIRQDTKTGVSLESLYRQDAITKGASAREIDEKIRQYKTFGLPGQSAAGFARQGLHGAGEIARDAINNANKNANSAWEWGKSFFTGGK